MRAQPNHRARAWLLAVLLPACAPDPEPRWTIGLERDAEFGALLSVWGPRRAEVYAVGGNPESGAMARFDGERWVDDALPDGFPLANWIYGVADSSGQPGTVLWVAGNNGQIARRDVDGHWTVMALATDSTLWGIWGAADDDMWTVGGSIPGDQPILAHWDGHAWTAAIIPDLDREFDALFKVWGTGPDNLFAVGQHGVILHYDGQAWAQQLAETSADLISLWGSGADDIVAVGGRANGLIARYDGQSWTSEAVEMLPGLNGVWLDGSGTGFAVGTDGVVIEITAGSFDWTLLDRSARPATLHGAFGLADGSRFGVGGSLMFSPPWTGVVVQFN